MISIVETGCHSLILQHAMLETVFCLIQDSCHVDCLSRTVDGTVQEYLGMKHHLLGLPIVEPVAMIHIWAGIICIGKRIEFSRSHTIYLILALTLSISSQRGVLVTNLQTQLGTLDRLTRNSIDYHIANPFVRQFLREHTQTTDIKEGTLHIV